MKSRYPRQLSSPRSRHLLLPIAFPAVAKPSELRLTLFPANISRVRPFVPLAGSEAELQIAADIVEPSQTDSSRPIEIRRNTLPHSSQSTRFAKAALVGLGRGVI